MRGKCLNGSSLQALGSCGPYRLASSSRGHRLTGLREHPSCLAIALTPSPLRAITRISTASSWVNIDGLFKAAMLSQAGRFYSVGVAQYCSADNTWALVAGKADRERRSTSASIACIWVVASDLTNPMAVTRGTQAGRSMVAE